MPGINIIKKYKPSRYYHIYNRGVNKGTIIFTEADYNRFLRYLEEAAKRYGIRIIKHALAANHFHLLIKQKRSRDIERLMRSLCTRYVLYINLKYERVGTLFQGTYRARLIKDEDDLLRVSDYIDKHFEGGVAVGETLEI